MRVRYKERDDVTGHVGWTEWITCSSADVQGEVLYIMVDADLELIVPLHTVRGAIEKRRRGGEGE